MATKSGLRLEVGLRLGLGLGLGLGVGYRQCLFAYRCKLAVSGPLFAGKNWTGVHFLPRTKYRTLQRTRPFVHFTIDTPSVLEFAC